MRRNLTRILERLESALGTRGVKYFPLVIQRAAVGNVRLDLAEHLRAWPQWVTVADDRVVLRPELETVLERTQALDAIARGLAAGNFLSAWRAETYAIASRFGDPPLAHLERAAARFFGIRTYSAHVNGLSAAAPAAMWIARRSPTKAIDPGMLDNLVAGGIASFCSVRETVLKEAWEESAIPAELARRATAAGVVHICCNRAEGLQVETIFVHDLELPADFAPRSIDGETIEHRRIAFQELLEIAAEHNSMTLDATLVTLDYMVRHGHLRPDDPGYCELLARLRSGV